MKLQMLFNLLLLPLFLLVMPVDQTNFTSKNTNPAETPVDCGKIVKYNQEAGTWKTVLQSINLNDGTYEIFMQSYPRYVSLAIVAKDGFKLSGKDQITFQNNAQQEQTFYVVETAKEEDRDLSLIHI